MDETPIHVIKLGGSLLDLPDLLPRWEQFRRDRLVGHPLIVVGGGRAADTVRDFDSRFQLDETAGHWLAVHAMQFNTRLVAAVLPGARLVPDMTAANRAWQDDESALIDPVAWLKTIEESGHPVPHRWVFTSDSIAALVAARFGATRLTLLKSTLPPGTCDTDKASELGMVDASFPAASRELPSIELINLRAESIASQAACCVLR